jgi:phage/plasmid-associated DNA primase
LRENKGGEKLDEQKELPITTVLKHAQKIALAGNRQVKAGKDPKSPSRYKWTEKPKEYTGYKDETYPTAIVCNEIPELKLHLVVIDLDTPKTEKDLPINILKSYGLKIIQNTYSTTTPSGGVHMYLLSKTKPSADQPRSTHNVNIDYQANTSEASGKYIVTDYRWDKKGENKELYLKMAESPTTIKIVENSDDILYALLKDLEKAGHIKDKKHQHIYDIVRILKPFVEEGTRQNYSCCISGYFKKQGYPQETTENIIRDVFSGDPEISKRVKNVELTYKKDDNQVKGWSYLKEFLPTKSQEELTKLTQVNVNNLKLSITQSLSKHRDPPTKMLADYIQKNMCLFKDLHTFKFYQQKEDGSFHEINDIDIILFCNKEFGPNKISTKQCYNVLKYVTSPIQKDYDLLEFENGMLNTKTRDFSTDKRQFTKVPKIKLPFNWDEEAPGLEIQKIITQILGNPKYKDDMEFWLRAVGHAFMGDNRIGKLVMVTGPSGTGKSTLTTILKRLFNTSEVSIKAIAVNERFTLYDMIDKDINIDDDVNNGILKAIGHLNTVATGNGLSVEVKGENRKINLSNPQIPRLFSNGNTLPPVLGEGFDRRLLLIHAENKIEYDERNDTLQNDILLGDYDKRGLEWLVYTAINLYWEKEHEPITSQKEEERMKVEHEYKSYPLKHAVETMFKDADEEDTILVGEVNRNVKKWCKWAFSHGKISREHRRPSISQIKKAMNHAGFDQDRITQKEWSEEKDNWVYKTVRAYVGLKLTEDDKMLNIILGED